MATQFVEVNSPNVVFNANEIVSNYAYQTTVAERNPETGVVRVTPKTEQMRFKTQRRPGKTGLLMIGWGGNNGTTVTGGVLANKHGISWNTKRGEQKPNFFGSITQSSTIRVGMTPTMEEVYVPLKHLVPMVNPCDLVIGGWDINKMNLADAMKRAGVFDWDLQQRLRPHMEKLVPMPAVFDINFIAANQDDRADNVIVGTKAEAVEAVRKNIRDFKAANQLDKVIILWTANTERFCELTPGVHDTAENLLAAVKANHAEVSPSACYAMAAILEGCSYINGAPQNTLVPGIVELAERNHVFLGGDDFKSGQTKMKSALVEFFVAAGIKPECIASYNHLGNNDGKNLNSPKQFRSKEISKSSVIDDMVKSNDILFPPGTPKPDHCVVIKYMPYVGDSKRAIDEYIFQIYMGGQQCIAMHNTCEDSLLAAPLMLDLIILTELMQRVTIATEGSDEFVHMATVLSILSYLLKAPNVPRGTPVVNALNRQKQTIENILRALIGLPPENNMLLECKMPTDKAGAHRGH